MSDEVYCISGKSGSFFLVHDDRAVIIRNTLPDITAYYKDIISVKVEKSLIFGSGIEILQQDGTHNSFAIPAKEIENAIKAAKFIQNKVSQQSSSDNASGELNGFKELMDMGIISKEEYELKRKILK